MKWYRSRKVAVTAAILVAFPGVWGWSIGAQQALVLYDDFNNPNIDPERWIGQDVGPGAQTDRLEQVREIRANKLRLASRIYGESLFAGGNKNGGSRIRFPNPSAAIRVMEAEYRVTQVEATACAPLGVGATTRGVLQGLFFNVGDVALPSNDRTGEVSAGIQITRTSNSLDPPNVLRVNAFVSQCTNTACTTSTTLGNIALGTVAVNEKVRLRLEWDEANSQFVFQFGENDPAFLNYALPVHPSVIDSRFIEVSNFALNCGGGVRSLASMELYVDDVYVNAGP